MFLHIKTFKGSHTFSGGFHVCHQSIVFVQFIYSERFVYLKHDSQTFIGNHTYLIYVAFDKV